MPAKNSVPGLHRHRQTLGVCALFEVLIARLNHPKVRACLSTEQFAALEHVVVSPRGSGFTTGVDTALAAMGHKRSVVLSAASFLFVPEIVAHSDFVALVPRRLVQDRADRLQVVECPFPVTGFSISVLWHERNHGHAAQRWVRERLIEATAAA